MIIKIVSSHEPGTLHIKDRIFTGPDRDHLRLAGILTFDVTTLYSVTQGEHLGMVGEWQIFGAALGLGTRRMQGDVELILEGDEEANASISAMVGEMVKGKVH